MADRPQPLEAATVPELVATAAARFGAAPAIEDGTVSLSFRDLAAVVRDTARGFIAAGVARGDRVAVWAPNRHEWIVAACGAHSAGAAIVPINTRFRGDEAGDVLQRSNARLLVTVDAFLGTRPVDLLRESHGEPSATRPVAGLPALERIVLLDRVPSIGKTEALARALRATADDGSEDRDDAPTAERCVEPWRDLLDRGAREVREEDAERRARAVAASDVSDVLFTSGTTGRAKGVVTTHGQNLRAFTAWSEIVGLRAGDRTLIVNPFFHAFGYKAGWLACLLRGATALPHAVFDPVAVLERIARERITVLPGPPTLFQTILDHPDRARHDLSSLRLAVTGAAVIPVELVRRMRDELGIADVITGYGLTEACGVVTMCRAGDDPETIATTAGRPLPGVEVACVDAGGSAVPAGGPGEVVVRGYNVMREYLDDAAATAAAVDSDGWLHTGDVGAIDARGNLRITDRIKDMFIAGGFNCYPAEIERMMLAHPEVSQVAVVGAPDPRLGEVGVAFVVPKPDRRPQPAEIIAWCRGRMANFKVPRAVEIVGSLPQNASGKVTKPPLRARAQQLWPAKGVEDDA